MNAACNATAISCEIGTEMFWTNATVEMTRASVAGFDFMNCVVRVTKDSRAAFDQYTHGQDKLLLHVGGHVLCFGMHRRVDDGDGGYRIVGSAIDGAC